MLLSIIIPIVIQSTAPAQEVRGQERDKTTRVDSSGQDVLHQTSTTQLTQPDDCQQ
jgi:hypothetical protein